ncbi:hypothetical protein PENTCL1PPCAC_11756, partial [Pristionchus entomophagus]
EFSTTVMSDVRVKFNLDKEIEEEPDVFLPPAPLLAGAHVSGLPSYHDIYRSSINNADRFWATVASELYFEQGSSAGLEWNFDIRKGAPFTRFMSGAKTNVAYNCLERNIKRGLGDKVAFLWEGNDPRDESKITYNQLLDKVIAFSAVLRTRGVKRGDTVSIYLPMMTELAIAMLACARIGAIHSVVFAGFSAESLAARIVDAKAKLLVTADGVFRGTKPISLKPIVDKAAELAAADGSPLPHVIIVEHLKRVSLPDGAKPPKFGPSCTQERDEEWEAAMESVKDVDSPVEWMDAEEPLFILYTSGSTGKPKGILHTTAGYMTYAYQTTKMSFDAHHETDVYWCTADCGWITGHSYVLYGPLMNGLTSVFFEGIPSYPDASRMWQITQKYKVTTMYTSPTAVRALMAVGDQFVTKYDRSSLKIIGTVGEPINPSAWRWLYNVVGEGRAAIVDTYWQTETGGHVIAPLPGATPTKPGSATFPCFGIEAVLVDAEGRVIEGPGEGNLCFARAWPGMLRGVWGDTDRFAKTYFSSFAGYYFTGDGAKRDEEGYIWVTGRVDDLMNVSGHLLSTAEIESALAAHEKVAEAAVVAAPHDIKGSFPYAFVTLNQGERLTPALVAELKQLARTKIGPIAVPDVIQQAPGLPKTRSGKVTRRILRKIAEGLDNGLGDTTTLIDESVITQLIAGRPSNAVG